MTGSEIVEEILYQSYLLGISDEVFDVAKSYLDTGMNQGESYEKAFYQIIEATDISDPR